MRLLLAATMTCTFLAASAVAADEPRPQLAPTEANVPYGPHPRNVLDFWKAAGDGPRPLLVYIHGGGWTAGDKQQNTDHYRPFLERGISCAAINYRLTPEFRLPAPVHDAARAIQFLRTKAKDWNIDTRHIALTGGSAGACTSMWLLLHDDLADPKATDPVLRESTRVCAAAVSAGQTSIDPRVAEDWLGPNGAHSHCADANVRVFSNHAVEPVVCSTLDLMSCGVKRQLLRPSRVLSCRKACRRSSQRFVSTNARICNIASALSLSQ